MMDTGDYRGRGGRGSYRGGRGGGGRGAGGGGFLQSQPQQQHQQAYTGRGRGRGNAAWGARGAPRGGYRGRGGRGRGDGAARHFDGQPADLDFVRVLRGHTKKVTAAALDAAAGTLYTGSQDGTVRAWALESGAPGPVVDVGGAVDSLLLEGGWLLVGMHTPSKAGAVKGFHLASGATCVLDGHAGQVLCLAACHGSLFSGGQDGTIRVWAYDAAASTFRLAGVLDASLGGHAAPVQVVVPAPPYLLSGDWHGTLKAWSMDSAAVAQTIAGAHDGVIMGALLWEGHAVTAGLDGEIKVWAPADAAAAAAAGPGPRTVLDPTPSYTHPAGGAAAAGFGGVLALAGTNDARGGAVLLASHAADGCVRVWDVPSFAERGYLGGVTDARALAVSPAGYVVVGDERNAVKVWRWRS